MGLSAFFPPVIIGGSPVPGVTSLPASPAFWTTIYKTADETRGVAAAADDAQLVIPVVNGVTYLMRGMLLSTQTRDDIGANISFTPGATLALTFLQFDVIFNRWRTAGASIGTPTNATPGASAKCVPFTDASPLANPTAGVTTAACQNVYEIHGMFKAGATGNLALRWWPQAVAGPVTLLKGSWLEYHAVQ